MNDTGGGLEGAVTNINSMNNQHLDDLGTSLETPWLHVPFHVTPLPHQYWQLIFSKVIRMSC